MTTSAPVAAAARAAAIRLANEYGPGLAADVEAALAARDTTTSRPDRYLDPVSIGSFIVSIASLAWMIYADLRRKTPEASPEAVGRQVRITLHEHVDPVQPGAGNITEIIVTEIIQAARSEM